MNVIFVEPFFPGNQREFVRGLVEVGATVVAIGESPKESLDESLRNWLFDYIQVPSVVDEQVMIEAVRWIQGKMWVDRLETTIEAQILPIAHVRKACAIPGISPQTAWLCRDKPAMKELLRQAGIPCAQSLGSADRVEIADFAQRTGFPLIIKPRSGAGASGTRRADDLAQLMLALDQAQVGSGGEVAVEEFIEGHEGFYDTLTVNGQVQYDFVTHYFPNVLEAMRNRWISPQFICTNRIDTATDYQQVKEMGRRVIETLGIETAATHMEWFFGPKGLKFSEIGCRPPGVRAWDLYNIANDLDLYQEWGRGVTSGQVRSSPSRRFSAGMIALRPGRDGLIAGYSGLQTIQEKYGQWMVDCHLPNEGTPTQGVEAGYMANAWIRMKHPDFDQLRQMLDEVGSTVKVHAG